MRSRIGKGPRKRTRTKRDDVEALLQRIIRLLLEDGANREHIREIVLSEIAAGRHRKPRGAPPDRSPRWAFIIDTAHVLTHWNNDPEYLQGAHPRPLTLAELSALAARALPGENPQEVIRTLRLNKAIAKNSDSQFVLTDRVARVRERKAALTHGLFGVAAHVHTVYANLRGGLRRFELSAGNPRFPLVLFQKAYDKFRQNSRAVLGAVDDWMLLMEPPPDSTEPTTRIVYGIYTATEDRPQADSKRRRRAPSSPQDLSATSED